MKLGPKEIFELAILFLIAKYASGCATDKFAQYRLDVSEGAPASVALEEAQEKYEGINEMVLKDSAIDSAENEGLLEATLKDVAALKKDERFKGEDYQKALDEIITNIESVSKYFSENAEAVRYAVAATFFAKKGDNKDDVRSRGYFKDDGFNFEAKRAEVQTALVKAAGVTDDDIAAKNDKYKKGLEVANAVLKAVYKTSTPDFRAIRSFEDLGKHSTPIGDNQADALVKAFCADYLKQQWNGNSGPANNPDAARARFTREGGKARFRAYGLSTPVNRDNFKYQKTTPRTGQ